MSSPALFIWETPFPLPGGKPLFIGDIERFSRSSNFYNHMAAARACMEELCTAFSCYTRNNSWMNSNFLLCSGGTDIISCFAGQNPTVPVYRGEIQTRNLGMAVESWNDQGNVVVLTLSFWLILSPKIWPVSQFRYKEEGSNLVCYKFFNISRIKERIT